MYITATRWGLGAECWDLFKTVCVQAIQEDPTLLAAQHTPRVPSGAVGAWRNKAKQLLLWLKPWLQMPCWNPGEQGRAFWLLRTALRSLKMKQVFTGSDVCSQNPNLDDGSSFFSTKKGQKRVSSETYYPSTWSRDGTGCLIIWLVQIIHLLSSPWNRRDTELWGGWEKETGFKYHGSQHWAVSPVTPIPESHSLCCTCGWDGCIEFLAGQVLNSSNLFQNSSWD